MTDGPDKICKCSDCCEAMLRLNNTMRHIIVENDLLRKMVDAFAENGDCGDEWLMADYRELPHVRARKTK